MRLLIFLAIFLTSTAAYPAVMTWDYDCYGEIEFKLYRGDVEGQRTDKVGIKDLPPGYYEVTANDGDLESEPSDPILLTYYYNAIKYEYDANGRVKYKGEHTAQDAAESDTTWTIIKFYYNESGRIIGKRIRTTSWTLRDVGW